MMKVCKDPFDNYELRNTHRLIYLTISNISFPPKIDDHMLSHKANLKKQKRFHIL